MGFAALNPSYRPIRATIASQNKIRRHKVDLAGGVDLEIRHAVAVQIAGDAGVVIARLQMVDLVAELAGDAGEIGAADEAEALVSGQELVRIDRRDVDLVALGVAEILDVVRVGEGRV